MLKCGECSNLVLPGQGYCQVCGHALEGLPPAEGELRKVAVLFADMVGFTGWSENRDPESVTQILNLVFSHLTRIAQAHGGFVDKYMGDSIMVLFGAPVSRGRELARALAAGLEMQEQMDRLRWETDQDLHLRIGVNEGEVIAGYFGALGKQTYTVMGMPVNLAQRLEAACPPDGVLTSRRREEELAQLFDLEPYGSVQIKKDDPEIEALLVRGTQSGEERKSRQIGPRSPLVGRDHELTLLEGFLAQGGITLLEGDTGLGKTRLLEALAERHPKLLLVPDLPYPDPPYGGIHRILAALKGQFDIDLSGWPMDEGGDLLRALEMDRFTPPKSLRNMEGDSLRTFLRNQGVNLLEALFSLAKVGGLALDDWSSWDDASKEWILDLATHMPVIISHRPHAEVPEDRDHQVRLEPLEKDAVRQLMITLGHDGKDELESAQEWAGGNPLFIMELVRANVGRDREDWPASIQEAVLTRMDRLPGPCREALVMACAAGPSLNRLVAVWEKSTALAERLATLVEQGFLFQSADGEFHFANAILRDCIYRSLLPSRRRALHSQMLLVLKRVEADPQELVFHAEGSGKGMDAWEAHRAAMHTAERHFTLDKALFHAQSACEHAVRGELGRPLLAQSVLDQARLMASLGQAEESNGLLAKNRLVMEEHCPGPTMLLSAGNDYILGHYQQAMSTVSFLLETSKSPEIRARGLQQMGLLRHAQGNSSGALEDFFRALSLFADLGMETDKLKCLGNIGNVYMEKGEGEAARKVFEEIIEQSRKEGRQDLLWKSLANLGGTLPAKGEFRRARESLEEARILAGHLHNSTGLCAIHINLAQVELLSGDLRVAGNHLETSRRRMSQNTFARLQPYLLEAKAEWFAEQGDQQNALGAYQEAASAARELGDQALLARISTQRFFLEFCSHDLDRMQQDSQELLRSIPTAAEDILARAVLAKAWSHFLCGRLLQAEEALGWVRELGERLEHFSLRSQAVIISAMLSGSRPTLSMSRDLRDIFQVAQEQELTPLLAFRPVLMEIRGMGEGRPEDEKGTLDLATIPWIYRGWAELLLWPFFRVEGPSWFATLGSASPLADVLPWTPKRWQKFQADPAEFSQLHQYEIGRLLRAAVQAPLQIGS